MKHTILFAAILIASVAVKAQAPLSFGAVNGTNPVYRDFNRTADTSFLGKKWFFTKYAAISSGFVAFGGGSGSFLSAPLGLQINRQLTNNLFAFGDLSVAPALFHSNNMFYQPGVYKNQGLFNANNFGAYSTAQMGLMYINNQRTFSISGSIGVSRNTFNYNGASPLFAPGNSPLLKNSRR